jgi:hypothetical protein
VIIAKNRLKDSEMVMGMFPMGAIGKDGHKTFCSEECREKGMKGN